MGSSRTRAQTCVPCISRQILNHCTTREVQYVVLIYRRDNLCKQSQSEYCINKDILKRGLGGPGDGSLELCAWVPVSVGLVPPACRAGCAPRTAECTLETANNYSPWENSNSCFLEYLLQEGPAGRWSGVAVFPVSEAQRGLGCRGYRSCTGHSWAGSPRPSPSPEPICSSGDCGRSCHPKHVCLLLLPVLCPRAP